MKQVGLGRERKSERVMDGESGESTEEYSVTGEERGESEIERLG